MATVLCLTGYGETGYYRELELAEHDIHACGDEFADVKLTVRGDLIYNDRGDCVGHVMDEAEVPAKHRWQLDDRPTFTSLIPNIGSIQTIQALVKTIASANYYDTYAASNGSYTDMPTWGPQTDRVRDLMRASGPSGDIVSWDTRSADVLEHLYLRRYTDGGASNFEIVSEAELSELMALQERLTDLEG